MAARNQATRAGGAGEQAALALNEPLDAGAVFTGRAVRDAEWRVDMAWFGAARSLMAARAADGRCPKYGCALGDGRGACAACRSRCLYGCGTSAPDPGSGGLGRAWVCGSGACEAAWQKERRLCSRCGRGGGIVSWSGGSAQPCEIRWQERARTLAAAPAGCADAKVRLVGYHAQCT